MCIRDRLRPGGRFGYQYDNIGNRKEAFEFGSTTDYETCLLYTSDVYKRQDLYLQINRTGSFQKKMVAPRIRVVITIEIGRAHV